MDFDPMDTERTSPRYSDIDVWGPMDILDAMIEGQFSAVAAVRAARHAIGSAAAALETRLRNDGRLIYAGAGTSGRLAVQDGAELSPTFGWPRDRLLLLLAGGDAAMVQAVEGAEDDGAAASDLALRHGIASKDALIAVAASGTTPFTVQCLRQANRLGALTVGLANNAGTPLLDEAQHPIFLDTGPEPIAGSTRMNAGTAQRIALSLVSSLAMIGLGRVHAGLMVDMQPTNEKLSARQERILMQLTGRSGDEARDALRQAGGNAKLAVLLLEGCSLDEGRGLLDRAKGKLRTAVALAKARSRR
jgi:N-acetylmuramic acid 6-phosphate etherase